MIPFGRLSRLYKGLTDDVLCIQEDTRWYHFSCGFTIIGSVSEGLVEKEQQHADTCKKKQSA
jgi:hypothetical protein